MAKYLHLCVVDKLRGRFFDFSESGEIFGLETRQSAALGMFSIE